MTNNALSMEDFSKLQAYLVVPVIVGDMMLGDEPLDDEARYALHESLCEIDPDSAALAIALAARHIASAFIESVPVAVAIKYESEKILQDYGPEWLSNYQGGPVDEENLFEMLQTLPEDLEALAELLETMRASILHHQTARDLCEILSIQARAHMEVADYILGELDKDLWPEDKNDIEGAAFIEPLPETKDNIIPFPAHRTRQ